MSERTLLQAGLCRLDGSEDACNLSARVLYSLTGLPKLDALAMALQLLCHPRHSGRCRHDLRQGQSLRMCESTMLFPMDVRLGKTLIDWDPPNQALLGFQQWLTKTRAAGIRNMHACSTAFLV